MGERKRYEWPGKPGKYDAEAQAWARDYTTHLRMLQGLTWRSASLSSVRACSGFGVEPALEQEAWNRALSEESGTSARNFSTAYFEAELCRGGCGREVIRFGGRRGADWGAGAAMVQNESGAWRGTVRGMCARCNAREARAGRVG